MSFWEVGLSRKARKFVLKNHLSEDNIVSACVLAALKISGEANNADIKKLHPPYENNYRVRVGDMRIVIDKPDFHKLCIEVVDIEWRTSTSYK